MEEMDSETNLLKLAIRLIAEKTDESLAEAVVTIRRVVSELDDHDCNDFADECDCEDCEEFPDFRGVTECLAFGLPQLVEKYGLNSEEAKLAERLIEGARV